MITDDEKREALRKIADSLHEERKQYKVGCPYEVYLCGVIQGIHYTLNYPRWGIAMRTNVEGVSKERDKIEV